MLTMKFTILEINIVMDVMVVDHQQRIMLDNLLNFQSTSI